MLLWGISDNDNGKKKKPEDFIWKVYESDIRGLYYGLLHINIPEEVI